MYQEIEFIKQKILEGYTIIIQPNDSNMYHISLYKKNKKITFVINEELLKLFII